LTRTRRVIEVAVDLRATVPSAIATIKANGGHRPAPRPEVAGYRLPSFPSCTCPRSSASQATFHPQAADTPGTQTTPEIDVEEKLKSAFDRGWSVIVWNDPVNLMDYVVYVFKVVLKMNEKDASRHMWEVHQRGKSQVARETREKSELIVHRLREFGLNATMEQEPA
jgi:ATP-dependent Clp protease adaptor protein ClpS